MGPALDRIHHSHRHGPEDCDRYAQVKRSVKDGIANPSGENAPIEE